MDINVIQGRVTTPCLHALLMKELRDHEDRFLTEDLFGAEVGAEGWKLSQMRMMDFSGFSSQVSRRFSYSTTVTMNLTDDLQMVSHTIQWESDSVTGGEDL